MDVKEQYKVKISDRFAALENLDGGGGDVEISNTWENITKNTRTSATESLGYYEF